MRRLFRRRTKTRLSRRRARRRGTRHGDSRRRVVSEGTPIPAAVKAATEAVAAKGFTMSPRPWAAQPRRLHCRPRPAAPRRWNARSGTCTRRGDSPTVLVTHTTHHLHHFRLHEYAHGEPHGARSTLAGGASPPAGWSRRWYHARGIKAVQRSAQHELTGGRRGVAAFGLSIAGALTPPVLMQDVAYPPATTLRGACPVAGFHSARPGGGRVRARHPRIAFAHSLLPLDAKLLVADKLPTGGEGEGEGEGMEEPITVTVDRLALRAGDLVRVLPGEVVPVDGEVVQGTAAVDEATLTGEPLLVPKAAGDQVSAGTGVFEGPLTIRATTAGDGSVAAGIARTVADAQARAAPVQRLADAVAGPFVYAVMTASAATFAF